MLDRLVPGGVVLCVAEPEMWTTPVSPAEENAIAGAAEGRIAEFRAGRAASRRALSELGIVDHDVIRDGRRPVWPTGVVGAITHTEAFCAAVVGRSRDFVGIGIDAERLDRPIEGGVRDRICSGDELADAAGIDEAAHIIFSAKEAFFKAYHPATDHWIGFDAARVRIDPPAGLFTVELIDDDAPKPSGLDRVTGRFLLDDGRVVSVIAALR